MIPEPQDVVSNYPRDHDLSIISPTYAQSAVSICDELDRWAAISFGSTVIYFLALKIWLPEVWKKALIACIVIGLWCGIFDPVRKSLLRYASEAGWATWRTTLALVLLFLCFFAAPGILFILTVRAWVASDMSSRGIPRPWARSAKQLLLQAADMAPEKT